MVSIQLLLLFYSAGEYQRLAEEGFNTTFVTVLCCSRFFILLSYPCFNTTFVTVLSVQIWNDLQDDEFQYNFCYCSIRLSSLYKSRPTLVSIQLLLLFYIVDWPQGLKDSDVSIQLLLLFYFWQTLQHGLLQSVSIQLLLLFYLSSIFSPIPLLMFQYNFCYCSIRQVLLICLNFHCFNTTFVTVLWIQSIYRTGS